jgi:hypothetical protein
MELPSLYYFPHSVQHNIKALSKSTTGCSAESTTTKKSVVILLLLWYTNIRGTNNNNKKLCTFKNKK